MARDKALLAYLVAGCALGVALLNAWVNSRGPTDHQHEAFFREVRAFMSAGGRNTAEQGAERDRRIEALEAEIKRLKGE